MDAREFLRLAETLARGTSEVEWRSAVSRAYYAAFHLARDLLFHCSFTVPRADRAHAYLWLRLAHAGDPDVENAGSDLNTLRGSRNRADYDLGRPFPQSTAASQVHLARETIRRLAAADQDPLKTQITDAMKIYERDVLKDVTWRP
jgi:uncharacterized protein (UPF0332 family)